MNLHVCAKFGPDRTTGDDVYTLGRIHIDSHGFYPFVTPAKIWRHTNFIKIYIKCLWTYSPTKNWANTIHYTIQTSEFFWSLYGIEKKCDPTKYGIYKIWVHYKCYFRSVWLPFIFFCVPLCYLSLSIIEVCYIKVKFMQNKHFYIINLFNYEFPKINFLIIPSIMTKSDNFRKP